jgi:hypothetical protein
MPNPIDPFRIADLGFGGIPSRQSIIPKADCRLSEEDDAKTKV